VVDVQDVDGPYGREQMKQGNRVRAAGHGYAKGAAPVHADAGEQIGSVEMHRVSVGRPLKKKSVPVGPLSR
jgi:hypothetical protein